MIKRDKKAKIQMYGFLLFFVINLLIFIFNILIIKKYLNSKYIILKSIVILYFFILFILFSYKLKKTKSILFLLFFMGVSIITKIIFIIIKVKTFQKEIIINLINFNYYLNLLNSFLFSFVNVYFFLILKLDRKFQYLLIPQIIVNNLNIMDNYDFIKKFDIIDKNDIKNNGRKFDISKFIAQLIYKSFLEYKKIIK